MAYNYFPATYQPNYYGGMYNPQPQIPQIPTPAQQPQPQPQVQAPQQQTNPGVNWVQGEAGARSWLVAPNTSVLLMDSESNRFYLKSSDASGMPLPLRIFEYEEKTGKPQGQAPIEQPSEEYVTKREFDEFKTTLKSRYKDTKDKVRRDEDDE